MSPRALAVLNPAARRGTAARRFRGVSGFLRSRFDLAVLPTDPAGRWREAVGRAVGEGVQVVLAAGGDGTVGAVASALLACPAASAIAFGAVGLGSSNDFHKPFGFVLSGVPLRVDWAGARPADVGRAVFSRGGEPPGERAFLVSASLGLTAMANAVFNGGRSPLLRFLQRHWVDGAVLQAALSALATHADVGGRLRVDGEDRRFAVSNLSVLRTPHLSGVLRYDTPVEPGTLAVNLCHDMGRVDLLLTLLALLRGRFRGRPRTRTWSARRVEVELEGPQPLELDGELVEADSVAFDVLPGRLLTCA